MTGSISPEAATVAPSRTLPDPVVAPPALTPDMVTFYQNEGYVLIKGLITPADAEKVKADIMDIMDVIGLGQSKLRQTREYLADTALDGFINSENLREMAGELMGGEASLYLPFTAVKSGGGGGQFHFHQDNQYTRFDGPGINMWFALTPMTEENGCLKVVPRSHLSGTLPSDESPDKDGHKMVQFEPDQFVSIIMEPGDCVAFTRLTIHGSGPNHTAENRVGYAVQFNRADGNYSLDGGQTFKPFSAGSRYPLGPVEKITPPTEKTDGH